MQYRCQSNINKINPLNQYMNKTISLPQIKQRSQEKAVSVRTRKSSIDSLNLDLPKNQTNNQESALRIKNKQHAANLQFIQKKGSISAKIDVLLTDRSKIGILENEKNTKNTQKSLLKISSEINKQTKNETEQTNKFLAKIKRQLNEFSIQNKQTSKQIRLTQAKLLQLKDQMSLYQSSQTPKQSKVEQKLTQMQITLNWEKYQKQVWKNIKENTKEQNAFLQKRSVHLLELQKKMQKKVKILNEKYNIKQEELNKQIYMLKQYQDYQKVKSETVGFELSKAEQKLKQKAATQKLIKQQQEISFVEQDEYHESVYKKKQRAIKKEFFSHKIYASMLQRLWQKQSQKYKNIQKSQKLLIMYCLNKDLQNFNPSKEYFSSFSTKEDLNSKIKQKQTKINQLKLRNQTLKKEWDQSVFKQIQIQEEIMKKLDKNIATGKLEQKSVAQNQLNQFNKSSMQKLQRLKNQINLNSRIKSWIKKVEDSLEIKVSKKSKVDEHMMAILKKVREDIKQKDKQYAKHKNIDDKRPQKLLSIPSIKSNGFNTNSNSPFRKKK